MTSRLNNSYATFSNLVLKYTLLTTIMLVILSKLGKEPQNTKSFAFAYTSAEPTALAAPVNYTVG